MNKVFLSLLTCAALVACEPGVDGLDGAAGLQGPQGEQGIPGEDGQQGPDAPARDGNIVWVSGNSVTAGQTAQLRVLAQYTEWTEAPTITTDYEGLSIETALVSPVSMIISVTAAADVRGGEANLQVGDLQLPKTLQVIPAARFVMDEEASASLRPGQNFSGKIVFAEGFGLAESTQVDTVGDANPVLFRDLDLEGSSFAGDLAITVDATIAPNAQPGAVDMEITTLNGRQVIPVWNAVEVINSPAADVAIEGTVEGNLEEGFSLFRITGAGGALINAGSVLRIEVQGEDFPTTMSLALPAGENDEPAQLWSNFDEGLDASSRVIELVTPRTGVYFLSVDHGEGLAGAEFTFSASVSQIQPQVADGTEYDVTLERPGHGAWIATTIVAGQSFYWDAEVSDESDASPAVRFFRNYTDDDGVDHFGQGLLLYGLSVIPESSFRWSNGALGVAWPEAWGESLVFMRFTDDALLGGGAYTMTISGRAE